MAHIALSKVKQNQLLTPLKLTNEHQAISWQTAARSRDYIRQPVLAGNAAQKYEQTIKPEREALIFGAEDFQSCREGQKGAVDAWERACEAGRGERVNLGGLGGQRGALHTLYTLIFTHT